MAGETPITITGNIVADPEMRFTPSGATVTTFRVASTPRRFNPQTNQWEDGEALFLTCNIWRQAAENVAESLTKGTRIIVTGQLTQRTFTNSNGDNRTVFEIKVDDVGPSLKYATAHITRNPRDDQAPRRAFDNPAPTAGGQHTAGEESQLPGPGEDEPPF